MIEEVRLDFSLYSKQIELLSSPAQEVFYGGAAGGGKSFLARIAAILWCSEIPGLEIFFFRRFHDDLILNHVSGPTGFRALLAPWVKAGWVDIVEDAVRFKKWGSTIHLRHCFTGDTLIQTTVGNIRIKDLVGRSGNIKVTESFTTRFKNVRLTQKAASIVLVKFNDGTSVRCTPDHRFLTLDGFVEAKNLVGKACLTNQSQLSVQQLKFLKREGSIGVSRVITDVPQLGSTVLCGSITTGPSLKALTSITSTRAKTTITSRILQSLTGSSIVGCTLVPNDSNNRQQLPGKGQVNHQGNGTRLQRVINGIKTRLSGFKLIGLTRIASNVEPTIKDSQSIGSAQRSADKSETESKEACVFKQCLSVNADGIEDVYCMTVPEIGLFPLSNGVLVSNCQYERDLPRLLGPEIHVLMIEEAGQFSESMIRFIRGRMRVPDALKIPDKYLLPEKYWAVPGKPEHCFPRALYTSNPGGIGHSYLKKAFVLPSRAKGPLWRADEDDGSMLRQFIPAKLSDNPSIDQQKYAANLKGLGSPQLVRALLDGDWDAIVGAFFPEISKQLHLIKPFPIPAHWTRFCAMDWGACGEGDPFSIGWYAVSDGSISLYPRGTLIRYRSWYGRGMGKVLASQVAMGVLSREKTSESITYRVAGGDIADKRGTGPSIYEILSGYGLHFQRADMRRVSGWNQVREYFAGKDSIPRLYFFEEQEEELETLVTLQHDNNDPNDCASGDDHVADEVRYAVMSRPIAQDKPVKPEDSIYKYQHPTLNELWPKREQRR